MEAFIGLSSVRSMLATWFGPESKFDRWLHPCYQSNVDEIHILQSTLGVKPLARLLSHPRSLRKFSHCTSYEDGEEKYSSEALINVLFQRARKILVHIAYTTDAKDSIGDNRTHYIGTVWVFEASKSSRLSRVLFIKNRSSEAGRQVASFGRKSVE
ncbi:MAG: hypothetical protein Q9161_006822 [Pseudevernia consocians]